MIKTVKIVIIWAFKSKLYGNDFIAEDALLGIYKRNRHWTNMSIAAGLWKGWAVVSLPCTVAPASCNNIQGINVPQTFTSLLWMLSIFTLKSTIAPVSQIQSLYRLPTRYGGWCLRTFGSIAIAHPVLHKRHENGPYRWRRSDLSLGTFYRDSLRAQRFRTLITSLFESFGFQIWSEGFL